MFKKGLLAVVVGIVASSAVAVSAGAGISRASTAPWLLPPNDTFTCPWIAAHPTAAAHWLVSCDPAGPPAATAPTQTSSSSSPSSAFVPLANGCQFVPASGGYVGTLVYAWSTFEYATHWSWVDGTNPSGNPLAYHWYLQLTDGTNYLNGTESSANPVNVPGQPYRWGAQNQGYYATHWSVCYS